LISLRTVRLRFEAEGHRLACKVANFIAKCDVWIRVGTADSLKVDIHRKG